jgi:hypothetical protein
VSSSADPNLLRAQRALASLATRPDAASYAGQVNEIQQLLDAQYKAKMTADDLSDFQLDQVELFIEGLHTAVTTRKRQAELEARRWELYERELEEVSGAVEKQRARRSRTSKDDAGKAS